MSENHPSSVSCTPPRGSGRMYPDWKSNWRPLQAWDTVLNQLPHTACSSLDPIPWKTLGLGLCWMHLCDSCCSSWGNMGEVPKWFSTWRWDLTLLWFIFLYSESFVTYLHSLIKKKKCVPGPKRLNETLVDEESKGKNPFFFLDYILRTEVIEKYAFAFSCLVYGIWGRQKIFIVKNYTL